MGLQLKVNVNWQQLEKIPLKNKVAGLVFACALIGGLFFYFMYLPKQKELGTLERKLADVQRQYNEKKAIADNLQTFQEEVRRLNEKLAQALTKLPNTAEIDRILIDLPNLAKEEELTVLNFKPGKDNPKGFYAEVPLNLSLRGPYNKLAKFYEKVGRLNRIISVDATSFTVESAKTAIDGAVILKAEVLANTYTFVEQPTQQQQAPAGGKPRPAGRK